jgi:hypothetical protein
VNVTFLTCKINISTVHDQRGIWQVVVIIMVFDGTYNNNSVISWWSIVLLEETEYPEKTTDLSQVTDTLYHITQNVSGDK